MCRGSRGQLQYVTMMWRLHAPCDVPSLCRKLASHTQHPLASLGCTSLHSRVFTRQSTMALLGCFLRIKLSDALEAAGVITLCLLEALLADCAPVASLDCTSLHSRVFTRQGIITLFLPLRIKLSDSLEAADSHDALPREHTLLADCAPVSGTAPLSS